MKIYPTTSIWDFTKLHLFRASDRKQRAHLVQQMRRDLRPLNKLILHGKFLLGNNQWTPTYGPSSRIVPLNGKQQLILTIEFWEDNLCANSPWLRKTKQQETVLLTIKLHDEAHDQASRRNQFEVNLKKILLEKPKRSSRRKQFNVIFTQSSKKQSC